MHVIPKFDEISDTDSFDWETNLFCFSAALEWSRKSEGREIDVVQCFDVSDLANKVYAHNFQKIPSIRSIEHLDAPYIDSLGVDTWLMSPPCKRMSFSQE